MAVNGGTPIPEEALKVMKEQPTYEQAIISDSDTGATIGATTWSNIQNNRATVDGSKEDLIKGGDTVYQDPNTGEWGTARFASSVSLDKNTGKITVNVPQVYLDKDPTLASYVDKNFFNILSANYKADDKVEYQNPYNLEEKINTDKYIEMLDSAIKDRVSLNMAADASRNWLISQYGGTPEKDKVINSITPDDMVTMGSSGTGKGANDDSIMSIPKYLSDAFPEIKELASFSNDFVKRGDFKKWYNLSGENALSKEQAVDIEKSIGRALNDVEHLDHDELARTLALGNYLAANDPSMSFFDATMTNAGETITGWNEGLWGGVAETIDLLVNAVTLPSRAGAGATVGAITGDYNIPVIPVKEILWPEDKAAMPNYNEQLEMDSYINSGGVTALGIGQAAGSFAEMGAEMALTSALTSALKAKTVSKMLEKGSETVAKDLAKETITAAARESAAYERPLIGEATRGARQGMTYAEKMNVFNENFGKTASKLGKMDGGVEMFSNLLKNAESLTADVLKITDTQLMMLDASQLTKVAESAYKVVRNAKLATTAIGVMSTFVTSAITFNKGLTDKIVRDPTAPGELKTWVKQMAWDSAFIGAQGLAIKGAGKFGSFVHNEFLAGTKVEAAYNKASAAASKAARGVKNTVSKPYRSLRNWLTNRKLEAQAMRKQGIKNSTLANEQALKEAEVVAEARAFTQSQSITPNETGYAVRNTTTGETAKFGSFSEAMGTQYYDPITMTSSRISPFQAATANEARLDNLFTVSGDIQQQEATLIHQFSDPDAEPIISGQINVAAEVDTSLLNMEYEAGMLSKSQQKTSSKLQKAAKKSPYEILNAGHSREVVVLARRQQELDEVIAKSEANGVPLDETNLEYQDALRRRDTAAEGVPVQIRNHITTQVLPAYRELEHSIVDYAIDPKHAVMNSEIINAMRESGEWGKDGRIYLRAAAAKDIPKGSYIPKDRFAMMDSTIGEHHSKILEEKDITWIGNGLNAMIREIASASAYKQLWEANKAYADVTIARTGEETMAAEALKGYKTDFQKEVVKGLGSIKEDMSKSMAVDKLTGSKGVVSEEGGVVGELPAGKQPKLLEKPPIILEADIEHTRSAGLGFMEPVEIRTTMSDNGLITSDYIANQETFEAFYKQSSDAGKKVLRDNFSNDIIADYRANVPDSGYMKRNMVDYEKLTDLRNKNYAKTQAILDDVDRLNAYEQLPQDAKKVTQAGEEYNKIAEEFWIDNIYDMDFSYEVEPPKTEKPKGKRGDNLKYKLDEKKLLEDVDHAIDNMVDVVYSNPVARLYMDSANTLGKFKDSASRKQFVILSEILSSKNKDVLGKTINSVAKSIIKNAIPPKKAVIKGNLDSLELKMKKLIRDRLESRLSNAQRTLVDAGEEATSETVNELLKKYNEEITGYAEDDKYIKTTDEAGRVIWAKVSPAFGAVFNKRPIFRPMGTVQSAVANMALLKRISLTNVNPRSFSKQAASDSAMAFVTTGFVPIPGLYTATSKAIAAEFGESIAAQIEKFDPRRYQNIKMVAEREGISVGEAAVKNMNAIAESKLPFTTMSQEFFRQTNINQYGGNAEEYRKTLNERINEGLRKASEVLGKPNDVRELWTRKGAGVQELYNRLKQGFNYAQAEEFRQFATNNATTNFQQKHAIFNALRHTVPYLTAGVSGSKSFWKMFELDPIGVTTRIWVGFIIPIMWLMGEVMEDEDVKKQYEQLSEEEKSNHIIISVNGQLTRIPVGEELGSIINPINHIIETLHNENKYDFWSLMLNDAVNFLPADFTGFTDPEMWNSIAGQAPNFLEVMDNGISKLLSATMPPFLQSTYMAVSGRDLYTGKKIDTNRVWIDDEGNLQIQSYSQSQFSQALAKLVGGDAGVIEKVTSGLVGTTLLHVLDTLTSAAQYVLSGGKEGSLSTAITKAADDMANPYAVHGYDNIEKQFNRQAALLQERKKQIESRDDYKKYNEEISKDKNRESRRKKINARNELLTSYQNSVENFLKAYKERGGIMDGFKFSKAVQLLTFEDALRADRSFIHLNTEYSDARAQAINSLYEMGITNPDGPSMIGYIAYDDDGNTYLKTWTPAQMQVIENSLYQQGDIHAARIQAIVEDGGERSLKNQRKAEKAAEQPYWDKYNSGKKLSSDEWDKIDDLRKAYNNQVLLGLKDYLNAYGPSIVLNNDAVKDYLEDIIEVPSAYETVNNRFVSSGGGKLNKQSGFFESYLKELFGV